MIAAALIVLGFNATFIPQFLLGNAGMPRRYYMYPERLPGAQRRLDRGRVAAGLRLRHHRHLPGLRAACAAPWPAQPLGRRAATSG